MLSTATQALFHTTVSVDGAGTFMQRCVHGSLTKVWNVFEYGWGFITKDDDAWKYVFAVLFWSGEMALPIHKLAKRKGVRIIVADANAETLSVVSVQNATRNSSKPGRPQSTAWEGKARALLQSFTDALPKRLTTLATHHPCARREFRGTC